jgi:transposase
MGTDERLALALQYSSADLRGAPFASALNQHTGRVYDLRGTRMPVESTTASAYALLSEAGLLQCGPRTAHRPEVPHVPVMQAVLDLLGMPVAPEVGSGARADDPLSLPGIARRHASLGRRGL